MHPTASPLHSFNRRPHTSVFSCLMCASPTVASRSPPPLPTELRSYGKARTGSSSRLMVPPGAFPIRFGTANYTSAFVRWFDGQVQPVPETTTQEYFFLYEFEPRTGTLALWDGNAYTSLSPPQPQLRPGNWMLAARPNVNREEVGLIPVLQFTLSQDGDFTYKVYEGSLNAMLLP